MLHVLDKDRQKEGLPELSKEFLALGECDSEAEREPAEEVARRQLEIWGLGTYEVMLIEHASNPALPVNAMVTVPVVEDLMQAFGCRQYEQMLVHMCHRLPDSLNTCFPCGMPEVHELCIDQHALNRSYKKIGRHILRFPAMKNVIRFDRLPIHLGEDLAHKSVADRWESALKMGAIPEGPVELLLEAVADPEMLRNGPKSYDAISTRWGKGFFNLTFTQNHCIIRPRFEEYGEATTVVRFPTFGLPKPT